MTDFFCFVSFAFSKKSSKSPTFILTDSIPALIISLATDNSWPCKKSFDSPENSILTIGLEGSSDLLSTIVPSGY